MDGAVSGRLEKADIHGFHTLQDLDVANIKEEARMRWLRPNEIHAILCNHKYFTINVKPVNLPKGGEIVLFDRKMLRNFRKDGHNWKKKKDGKTIKEAHEHLKVGNEERIHVYYAHGQDNPTFVRRCYWLLDKTLEHIVLVHYRETRELQASPVTPLNSNSSSVTDQSPPRLATEEFDSGAGHTYYSSDRESPAVGSLTVKNHEMTLHEINTLEWDELLVPNNPDNSTAPEGGKVSGFDQSNQIPVNATLIDVSIIILQECFISPMFWYISGLRGSRNSEMYFHLILFELTLKNRLKEWLLERIVGGHKSTEYDDKGQGVIHLCAILGYTWAIRLFSLSGLSLDFRDKLGWTALHWAARYGREKMVAVLLSSGAKPNLVTDPTSKNPSGCTPADLAYMNGYEGLAAYLSEKALVAQFEDMSVAGNISGTLQTHTADTLNQENISEEELYLKDSLAAYRTAADAAARIQVAFREHSLKVRTTAVEISNPEYEARNIIAAMKIQHAFRNFETKKKMAAATRIQYRFRSWKIRKEFLNMRRQAIRIQAAFRAFQVRMHYRKILWSVGVLEKAVLRWRLKRKGFRGLQVAPVEAAPDQRQESDTEEDFYRTSRKQAEERVVRAVVRVQAMFRSKKAQQEYRQMKLAHNEAQVGDSVWKLANIAI
ncbi:IQ domain-containing protein/CG-1 domain-containing protein/Ank_2 domain-containing protein [Cephalotus follicularis]|uniref:IQ domain-containing protein/CG-1 domain-containing protein/Ank_2 domain-containing protein n=1 Tax=Cephalotus follicularis TaxID=3775 RepID=A0A1Q3BSE1_CEPFO|nr:IQ domain-containing protein/CG-1 domain-containing protein/Ank_2 domain-containing protein [Cephalotus follicularis]